MSEDLERRILGISILGFNEALNAGLVARDFRSERHRLIFSAFKRQKNSHVCIIRAQEDLGDKVSAAYLASLLDGVPSSSIGKLPTLVPTLKLATLKQEAAKRIEIFSKAVDPDFDPLMRILKEVEKLERLINPGSEETLDTGTFDTIEEETLEWLWPGHFPLGMISLLAGDPGIGKSFFSIWMAAQISKGAPWPDIGAPTIQGRSLIFSEDSISKVQKKRLRLAGADQSKVHWQRGIRPTDPSKPHGLFSVENIGLLLQTAENIGPDLRDVFFDPITDYQGNIDSHKNMDVRGSLQSLSMFAEKSNTAVIMLAHLTKDDAKKAMYRTQGSVGYISSPRAVFCIAPHPESDEGGMWQGVKVFSALKQNYAAKPPSLGFRIVNGEKLEFLKDTIELSGDDVLQTAEDRAQSPKTTQCIDFLKDTLSGGPVLAADIAALAGDRGFHHNLLLKARRQLGIKPQKDGFQGQSLWELPG